MVEGWDVNNEMIHGSFFVDQSGDPGIRVEMFQRAAERSPELLLFVNDYNIIAGSEAATYTSLIQDLLDQGAPVSAIGVQVRHLQKLTCLRIPPAVTRKSAQLPQKQINLSIM